MSKETRIAWTDSTFNPWIGCSKISPGCANCYAAVSPAARFKGIEWGHGKHRQRTSEGYWKQPLAWNQEAAKEGKRPRVFCGSLCDWLDDEIQIGWSLDLLDLVDATPNLDWLMLTKRPENFERLGRDLPANVWLGISAENQEQLERRAGIYIGIPATVHFLSCEPLLGPLDFRGDVAEVASWVIAGGESGPNARPMPDDWVRDIRDQCIIGRVPFFFKQRSDRFPAHEAPEIDGKTWRQFPKGQP